MTKASLAYIAPPPRMHTFRRVDGNTVRFAKCHLKRIWDVAGGAGQAVVFTDHTYTIILIMQKLHARSA